MSEPTDTRPREPWDDIVDTESALREAVKRGFEDSREKSLALTKLDECLLWLRVARPVSEDMRRLLASMRSKP